MCMSIGERVENDKGVEIATIDETTLRRSTTMTTTIITIKKNIGNPKSGSNVTSEKEHQSNQNQSLTGKCGKLLLDFGISQKISFSKNQPITGARHPNQSLNGVTTDFIHVQTLHEKMPNQNLKCGDRTIQSMIETTILRRMLNQKLQQM